MNSLLVQPAPAVTPGGGRPAPGGSTSSSTSDTFDRLLDDALTRHQPNRHEPSTLRREPIGDDRGADDAVDRAGDDRATDRSDPDRSDATDRSDDARADRTEGDRDDRTDHATTDRADGDRTDEATDEGKASTECDGTDGEGEGEGEGADGESEIDLEAVASEATPTIADPALVDPELVLGTGTSEPTDESNDGTADTTVEATTPVETGDLGGTPDLATDADTDPSPAGPVEAAIPTTENENAPDATAPSKGGEATGPIAVTTTEASADDAADTDTDTEAEAPEVDTTESVEELPDLDAGADDTGSSSNADADAADQQEAARSALAATSDESATADTPATATRAAETVGTVTGVDTPRPTSALAEPAAASTTTEAAATLTNDVDGGVDGALFRQVQRALSNIRLNAQGEQTLTIRLHPEELGSVTVRVTTAENGVRIGLVADNVAAAGQLSNQSRQLEQELADGGLEGASVDVSHGETSHESGGDTEGDGSSSGGRGSAAASTIGADPSDRRSFRSATSTPSTIDLDL